LKTSSSSLNIESLNILLDGGDYLKKNNKRTKINGHSTTNCVLQSRAILDFILFLAKLPKIK